MEPTVRPCEKADLPAMISVWNEVVEDGIAFPQEDLLDESTAPAFFESQTAVHVAEIEGEVLGLFILHPNNVGRCGHVANASFAVASRSAVGISGARSCAAALTRARCTGFAACNSTRSWTATMRRATSTNLWDFPTWASIPGGFRMKDGHYEDIHVYYHAIPCSYFPAGCGKRLSVGFATRDGSSRHAKEAVFRSERALRANGSCVISADCLRYAWSISVFERNLSIPFFLLYAAETRCGRILLGLCNPAKGGPVKFFLDTADLAESRRRQAGARSQA